MRYTVQKQADGEYYCVWDNERDAPAEAFGMRYINLRYEKASEEADTMNEE